MLPGETAALAAIRSAYGEPVAYTGAGVVEAPLTAVRSEVPADEFQGWAGKARRVSFEIAQADLPEQPRKNDVIAYAGGDWRVIDVNRRDDVEAWVLFVERG
jgi:hypothetical protein